MLERVVTRSRILDLIQLVNDDVIDSIFRPVASCGESPVSEDWVLGEIWTNQQTATMSGDLFLD